MNKSLNLTPTTYGVNAFALASDIYNICHLQVNKELTDPFQNSSYLALPFLTPIMRVPSFCSFLSITQTSNMFIGKGGGR